MRPHLRECDVPPFYRHSSSCATGGFSGSAAAYCHSPRSFRRWAILECRRARNSCLGYSWCALHLWAEKFPKAKHACRGPPGTFQLRQASRVSSPLSQKSRRASLSSSAIASHSCASECDLAGELSGASPPVGTSAGGDNGAVPAACMQHGKPMHVPRW